MYIPPRVKKICLEDLISFNFNTTFGDDSNVNCSNCRIQTSHKLTREQLPDILCFEIIRVTERKYQGAFIWSKNSIPISFPTDGIKVPGSNKKYRVIGTSHHKGSLHSGHWITTIRTEKNWYQTDDLKSCLVRVNLLCCIDNPNG